RTDGEVAALLRPRPRRLQDPELPVRDLPSRAAFQGRVPPAAPLPVRRAFQLSSCGGVQGSQSDTTSTALSPPAPRWRDPDRDRDADLPDRAAPFRLAVHAPPREWSAS